MAEFHWARQRAKRALLFWVLTVLTLDGVGRRRRVDPRQQYQRADLVT